MNFYLGHIETKKWGLTSDGKSIYFLNQPINRKDSWKILELADSSMIVSTNYYTPSLDRRVIEFIKIKNGR